MEHCAPYTPFISEIPSLILQILTESTRHGQKYANIQGIEFMIK